MATFNNGESLSSVRTKINDAIDKIDGNATISNNITVGGNIAVTGTVDGRDVAADGTKLDGIEASADVTDTANVTAAGALMDSELTSEASVKALDQGVATTDSPTFAALGVNGTVTADGLTVEGAGAGLANFYRASANANFGAITFKDTANTNTNAQIGWNANELRLDGTNTVRQVTGGLSRMLISSGGDISFYEATGTTPKFFWDASAESLGIGTSSPVNNSNRATLGLQGAWGGQLDIMVGSTVHAQFGSDNFNTGLSARIQSQDGIVFRTNGNNERLRIDSGGAMIHKGAATFNEDGGNADFRVESDTNTHALFVDASENRVGVRTSTPYANLSVGGGTSEDLLSVSGYSGADLNYNMTIRQPGTSSIVFDQRWFTTSQNDVEVMRFSGGSVIFNEGGYSGGDFRVESDSRTHALFVDASNGRVGIGASTVDQMLHVEQTSGTTLVKTEVAAGSVVGFEIAKTGATNQIWRIADGVLANGRLEIYDVTNSRSIFNADSTEIVINENSANLDFRVESDTNTHALFVDAGAGGGTGAVGVGTNNPNRKFVVSEEGVNGIELDPNISGESEIISYNRSTNAYTPLNFAASAIELNGVDSGSVIVNQNGNSADFRVESDSDAHALFVDASTNRVGISTSAPPVQFTVGGGDGTAELLLWGDNANSTSSRLIFGAQDPYTAEIIQFRYNSDSNLLQLETDITFGVGKIVQFDRQYGRVVFNEDSALNADFRVESDASSHAIFSDSSNNVVTFFTSELPIMGSSSVQGVSIGNGGNAEMRVLNTTTSPNMWLKKQGTVGNAISFYKDTSSVGTIYVNASSVSYNTTSDYRLKENVVDLTGATDRLKQLEPKRFNFIADADTTVDGFLAHEAQTVVPEAVTGTHNEVDDEGNPVYQGIDQAKLVPLLVATIKELEARITALENA